MGPRLRPARADGDGRADGGLSPGTRASRRTKEAPGPCTAEASAHRASACARFPGQRPSGEPARRRRPELDGASRPRRAIASERPCTARASPPALPPRPLSWHSFAPGRRGEPMLTNVRAVPASLAPDEAVDRLEALHAAASNALRDALERYLATGVAADAGGARPLPLSRAAPRPTRPTGPLPAIKRAYAKFQGRGVYATTVTQPAFFRALPPGAAPPARRAITARRSRSASSRQEIPYPYVFERGDELARGASLGGRARAPFPDAAPRRRRRRGRGRDLDHRRRASRGRSRSSTRCASTTRCAASCTTPAPTGARSSPGSCSPTTTATSTSSSAGRSSSSPRTGRSSSSCCPAASRSAAGTTPRAASRRVAASPWHRFQMPAYHLVRERRAGRHAGQHRRRPLQRQEHHRPPRGAAAALLADDRPLRRPAAVADHRRLRARARLSAPRPHPRRPAAARDPRSRRSPRCRSRCRRRRRASPASAATR